jgi:hypothetical protein
MNLATIIALGLIIAFVLFVIYVRVFANKTGRIEISAPDEVYSFGDTVGCQITITALRACRVNNLRAELHCNRRKLRHKSTTDRESLLYLAEADINVDQDWAAGQSETFDVALQMPSRGELPDRALAPDTGQHGAPLWTIQARARFGGYDIKRLRRVQTSV